MLSGILSFLFGSTKSTISTVLIVVLIGYGAYTSVKLFNKVREYNNLIEKYEELDKELSKLKSEYELLKSDYVLSEESNKKLKEINEENIAKATAAMEALKDQMEAERKIQNDTIKKYRNKIAILQKAKNVNPSQTTGVTDQDTSRAFIDRINGIIDDYNRGTK